MKVLIALDLSPYSDAAFESVVERSWPEDLHFRLMTVVEPINALYGEGWGYAPVFEAQTEYRKHCRSMIDEKIARLKSAFKMSDVTGDIFEGNIPDCILSEAKDWGADMLIVGSHGRAGWEKLFLGSVAELVAAHAPCSVEIVKQKQNMDVRKH